MKPTIGVKVNCLIITALIMVSGACILLSVSSLRTQGEFAVNTYKASVTNEKKYQIRDMVNAAYTIASEDLSASKDKESIRAAYGGQVKAVVVQAMAVLSGINESNIDQNLEMRKAIAIEIIDKMRWGSDGQNYLWIQDRNGMMIHHPITPSLNGKDLAEFKDPDGKQLFKEMNEVCDMRGSGFVDYKWPKPGFDTPQDKISYVELFESWGWILGAGIYLESTQDILKKAALHSIGSVRYGENGDGYFFIYDSKGTCILMPSEPGHQGKNDWNLQDEKNNYIIRDFIKVADAIPEGGYITDYRSRPGSDVTLAKTVFCRKLGEWDWYIGTGIYTDDVDAAIASKNVIYNQRISDTLIRIISILLVVVALFMAASYVVVAKGIVKPIRNIINMLKEIANGKGDLTKRIVDYSRDETSELAEFFNQFVENVQSIISGVKKEASLLRKSSEKLSDISVEMNRSARDTADRSESVAAAAEEMSANMTSMAASMEEATININMVASAAEEMASTISEISQNTEKASRITTDAVIKTERASAQVEELGLSAKEIFAVVETISDISAQVNLLALNATIEAARAGDAGKGFSIVANEIKDLANQTAEASNHIKDRVDGIQNSTDCTISEITSIRLVVTEINEIVTAIAVAVGEQSAATNEIAGSASQASMGISEVNENISQGSLAAQEVSREIVQVTESAVQMSGSSSQVREGADGLSTLAHALSDMINEFKV